MPYLGNELATQFQAFATQTITGDGSTGYTLDRAVANGKELLVYINNVKQEEGSGKSYTASGTTITFSEAVASGDSCYVVFLGSAVQTVTAPAGSIVSSQIANASLELPSTLDMNGNELILDADGDTSITSDTDDRVDIKVAGSDIVHVTSTGLGIDTTSPDTPLTIDGGSTHNTVAHFKSGTANTYIKLSDSNTVNGVFVGATTEDMTLWSNNTERVRIDSSGNVLVGQTSANSNATGIGALPYGSLFSCRDGGAPFLANRKTSDGTIVALQKDGTNVGTIGCGSTSRLIINGDSNGIAFERGGTEEIRIGSNVLQPSDDNDCDLGLSHRRFDDIHATNGTIQTSDENEKQDIASATAKELNVAKKLSTLFKTFRWKDKVTEKGDKARTHTGIVAQEVQSAFSAEGLDASNYGLFTSDTWWEKEISVDAVEADEEKGIEAKDAYTYMDTKEEKTDGYTEKTRLGVRYPELFSFIFSSIEARLTALEAK